MRKYIILTLFIPLIFLGCKSKEEKAAVLIKSHMAKTLYDFNSYEPIETTVTEAKLSAFTDSLCWAKAQVCHYLFSESKKALKEAQEALENMLLWGPPSYYSDSQYYKYRAESDEKISDSQKYLDRFKVAVKELREDISALDTTVIVGWEVKHKFRCNNRGGRPSLGDYRYVIDKNFQRIIIEDDTDEDDNKLARGLLEGILDGTIDLDLE